MDASRKALEMADVKPEDVDLLLLCTSTPDDLFGSAPQVLLVNKFLPPHPIGNMNLTKNHQHIIKKMSEHIVAGCGYMLLLSSLHCSSLPLLAYYRGLNLRSEKRGYLGLT